MRTANVTANLIDNYFMLLKNLSPDNKLDLIARLSKSLKTTEIKADDSWKSLFGAMILDQSADNFVDELKRERNFSRKSIEI